MDETTAAKTAAGVSSLTLALLGVSHYALIWGFVGALAALYQHRERLGPLRAICFVVLSTFCGAAMATWSISYLAVETRPVPGGHPRGPRAPGATPARGRPRARPQRGRRPAPA